MTQFVAVDDSSNRVLYGIGQPDAPDLVGPAAQTPPAQEGIVFHPWQGAIPLSDPPAPDAVLEWQDAPVWVASISEIIAHAIDKIDSAADSARLEVISRQTNTEEYKRAEQQARAFSAAGYPSGSVPSCVASWAKAKYRDGWTAQEAADDIIATADRWYGILDSIRDLRLCAKEDVRHASTSNEVSARVQQFTADLASLMMGAS